MASPSCAQEQPTDAKITVDAGKVANKITPWMYGSCIEDVNHEIYGGFYDQKLFGESFEEPPASAKFSGWDTFGGNWQGEGGGVSVEADAGAKLVNQAPAFGDGSVEAQIRFPSGNGENAGLLVRVGNAGVGADNFEGYEVSLQPGTRHVILGKHRHNWTPLRDVAANFNPTQWTKLRVELQGPRIQVFVNDGPTAVIDYTDTEAPLLTGSFAIRTWNSNAGFQNVNFKAGNGVTTTTRFSQPHSLSVSGMWDTVQSGTAKAEFLRDQINPYNGSYSQMIYRGAGTGMVGIANRGLNRWGIAVSKGQSLGGRLYLRAHDLKGAVTLNLQSADGKQIYATQKITNIGSDWAKYPINLKSTGNDAKARFVVSLHQPGSLWVDQATLTGTGTAQFKGLPLRADIGNKILEQGVTFMRYGGTMVNAPDYRWKKMIGDPDKRPPYRGHWYSYSTNGFGIEDFLRYCEAANIEAAFAINVEETAQDAADLVEYLNGDLSTTWGRRRAENGHPKPYNVRWIEIGNEEVIWGDNSADYDHYVERFNVLYDAMHAKDPNIKFIHSAWWRPDSANMERVFKGLNGKADYWDLHVWSDDANSGTTIDRDIAQMQSLFQKWVPGSTMKCVIFEENGGLHSQQRALGHATTLNAARRHGDFVLVSCPANALQPWQQNDNGWDQGQIFFTPSRVWGMPPFYAQQMASANHQPLRVDNTVTGNLDVTATRSEDGKTLVLHVVNVGAAAQTASVDLSGFEGCQPNAKVWTLAGALNAANPADGPETRTSQQTSLKPAGTHFTYPFAAHSYTIIRLTR